MAGMKAIRLAGDELDGDELDRVAGGLSINSASRLGKKLEFFEAWPAKGPQPELMHTRRKI